MSYVCKVIFQEILAQKNYAGSKSHIYTKNVKLFLSTKWATSWQNQQNGMCTQWRLRSVWASAQSDQSLRCALNG